MEKTNIFKYLYALDHSPIDAYFSKNSTDFVVREEPLYDFSGDGEHAIVQIQKKDLTTFEALGILSEHLGVKMRDFGYAGLKDKEGMTTQFISFPAKLESNLAKFSHEKMKILNSTRHKNKLKIGHLRGNNFFIRLKKVLPYEAKKLENIILQIDKEGFANYFGYQRFGKFKDNAKQGEDILNGTMKLKNPKMRNLLISAYQSELFNKWLSKRIEINKFAKEFSPSEFCEIYNFSKDDAAKIITQNQFYKLLEGEVLGHYPHGKLFLCENIFDEVERFTQRNITSYGLLNGEKAFMSEKIAKKFEDEIYEPSYQFNRLMNGSRRFAWSYLEDLKFNYNADTAQFSISFFLQKGSYATVVLEEILHKNIFE